MNKILKRAVLIVIIIIMVFGSINMFLDAKNEKEEEQKIDANKVAARKDYEIVRENNKYTLKSNKLKDKNLKKAFYDDKNVYLYYSGEENSTLLKYNIKSGKVVVLYEESVDIHGKIKEIGSNYRLGNKLLDSKFNEITDYPEISNEAVLLPNLENILLSTESGLIVKNVKDGNENLVLENTETDRYKTYDAKTDGKYLLAIKESKEKKSIVVLDHNYKLINTIEYKENTNYSILGDKPYLLESTLNNDKTSYIIYDAKDISVIYNSKDQDNYTQYIFEDTKTVCNDKKGNLVLFDYISKETRTLINKEKEDLNVQNFLMSSDDYSLVLTLEEDDMSFYLFYL